MRCSVDLQRLTAVEVRWGSGSLLNGRVFDFEDCSGCVVGLALILIGRTIVIAVWRIRDMGVVANSDKA